MPIPNLPADAPIAQTLYPIKIRFFRIFWNYFNSSRAHGIEHKVFQCFAAIGKGVGERFMYVDKPL